MSNNEVVIVNESEETTLRSLGRVLAKVELMESEFEDLAKMVRGLLEIEIK